MTRTNKTAGDAQIQSFAARATGKIDCPITAALAEKGYRFHYFQLDAIEGKFPGFTLGDEWNGWECPKFSPETSKEIMAALKRSGSFTKVTQTPAAITYYEADRPKGWGSSVIDADNIETSAGTVTLFAVGAYGWCWEKAPSEA